MLENNDSMTIWYGCHAFCAKKEMSKPSKAVCESGSTNLSPFRPFTVSTTYSNYNLVREHQKSDIFKSGMAKRLC